MCLEHLCIYVSRCIREGGSNKGQQVAPRLRAWPRRGERRGCASRRTGEDAHGRKVQVNIDTNVKAVIACGYRLVQA